MKEINAQHHVVSYSTYFLIWLGLLVLTSLTVAVAGLNLGGLNIIIALAVATAKTSLVLLFFMHLKYEDRIFFLMFMVTIITLATIIGVTFLDLFYRYSV